MPCQDHASWFWPLVSVMPLTMTGGGCQRRKIGGQTLDFPNFYRQAAIVPLYPPAGHAKENHPAAAPFPPKSTGQGSIRQG
jgi:hypothetical protein